MDSKRSMTWHIATTRGRQQRYSKAADWEYIARCSKLTSLPFIGNGDVFSYEDVEAEVALGGDNCTAVMVARGALVKPWVFTGEHATARATHATPPRLAGSFSVAL